MTVHKVWRGGAAYAATEFAVRGLSEGLRQEVRPYNIFTTVVSPGAIATNLLNSITEHDVVQAMRERTAEIAQAADSFARAVAFAIS